MSNAATQVWGLFQLFTDGHQELVSLHRTEDGADRNAADLLERGAYPKATTTFLSRIVTVNP